MPEGHVIHRLAVALTEGFSDRPVRVTSPQGRFAGSAELMDGRVLIGAEAIGKHLFIDFDAPLAAPIIHIHLGLIGKLRLGPPRPVVGEVRLRLASPELVADLHGPQWCRLISPAEHDAVVEASGPDPLRADADPDRGWQRVHRASRSIAALLMDQRIAAGVGNIFRAEVLYRHRLDPFIPGKQLKAATWRAIWADLVDLMAYAVGTGRIDTVRSEHDPELTGRPPRVDPHGGEVYVYRRAFQPCLVCGGEIRSQLLEGRSLYWCPRCQRRKS